MHFFFFFLVVTEFYFLFFVFTFCIFFFLHLKIKRFARVNKRYWKGSLEHVNFWRMHTIFPVLGTANLYSSSQLHILQVCGAFAVMIYTCAIANYFFFSQTWTANFAVILSWFDQSCYLGRSFWVGFGFRPKVDKISSLIRARDVLFVLGAQKYNQNNLTTC